MKINGLFGVVYMLPGKGRMTEKEKMNMLSAL